MSKTSGVKIEDRGLVRRFKLGNTAAMEQLVVKYQDRIFNVILKMCGNSDDAAELTQDTFVKVIENIQKFRGRSSFYTWAFRIAVNLTLNFCQRRKKAPARGVSSLDWEHEDISREGKFELKQFLSDESSPDPAGMAQQKEVSDILYKALERLDERHKAVVVLRDIEGMNYKQIAQVLELELGTVKSRLSRARNSLKEILESILK